MPIQIDLSRSRWPVLSRNATTAPMTRIASKPFAKDDEETLKERLRRRCRSAASARRTVRHVRLDRVARPLGAANVVRAGSTPLKSVYSCSIDATTPGSRARAGVSIGSNARYASNARSPASVQRPSRAAVSDCSSSEQRRFAPRPVAAPLSRRSMRRAAAIVRSRVGSVRRYATTLCTCAGVNCDAGGIGVPGMPARDRDRDLRIAALDLPRERPELRRQLAQRARHGAVAKSGHAVALDAALRRTALRPRRPAAAMRAATPGTSRCSTAARR